MGQKGPSYSEHEKHEGFLMPYGFPVENFSTALEYATQKNDLFIATYPKCGTTLCQHMIYLLLNGGDPIKADEKLDRMFPHIEEVGKDFIEKSAVIRNDRRLIKTHLPYSMTPMSKEAKYIFIARNPKDCVVSFYHHTRGFPQHYNFENGDFDVFFDLFFKGEVDFGSYFKTLRSWIDHKDDDNVLFLTYENIQKDKASVVREIAKFIGDDVEDLIGENDNSLLDKVLHHSSLTEMKKHPLRWCSERKVQHTPFIRNGKVGAFNEMLTEEQAMKLDQKMKQLFTSTELNLLGSQYYS